MWLRKYLSSFTKPKVDELVKICNFTEEEESIVYLLAKDKSRVEISQEIRISTRTLDRRIAHIRYKIEKSGKDIDGGDENGRSSDL